MRTPIALVLAAITARPAVSMEFSIVTSDRTMVLATGPITAGDSDKLRGALLNVPRDQFGLKLIALNSPGGSVEAALEMATVIDGFGAVTVVPPGATCASACATILFVAGKFHKVLPGGALGLHTCYNGQTKIRDDLCNDRIAQFAAEHGAGLFSTMPFMRYTSASDVFWFSSGTADSFGLNHYPENQKPPGYGQCIFDAIKRA